MVHQNGLRKKLLNLGIGEDSMEKKKILITGYTSRMCGSTRVRGDYVTFVYLLEDILIDMGYEVERRLVPIGENIFENNFYFAFCGVAPLSSISAHHVPETHRVMEEMKSRHCVFFDDWSACAWGKSVRGTVSNWERYLEYKKFPYPLEIMEDTKISMSTMANTIVEGFNAPVLAPMFTWGDHDLLIENNYKAKLVTIDPSHWMKYPYIKIPNKRERVRQWVMAALSNHTAWANRQRFTFPVKFVGNVRMESGVMLPEDTTIQLFADSFGVLSVGYPSAGSGWWRSRYLNAAWAETPIYSDVRDAEKMGDAYQGNPLDFEREFLTPKYLERIRAQAQWLNSHLESKEQVIAKIKEVLK
jgi:hypothetical protein